MSRFFGGWAPYVPMAERRRQAAKAAAKLAKSGHTMSPVVIDGRAIANTFWGKGWCDQMESFHDYENRLPRGRAYARNGSVIDLQIEAGIINALVQGSSLYKITVKIKPFATHKWAAVKTACAGQIASVVELLRGKFSHAVMEVITHRENGLFPQSGEIDLDCSCPDSASMCKHIAAVLYGVGARLDTQPELIFLLRNVDHLELVSAATAVQLVDAATAAGTKLADDALAEVFGIELDESAATPPPPASVAARTAKAAPPAAKRGRKPKPAATPVAAAPAVTKPTKRGRKAIPEAQPAAPAKPAAKPPAVPPAKRAVKVKPEKKPRRKDQG